VATNGAGHRGYELNDGLMPHAHRIFEDATPENRGRDLLFVGKAWVKPVHQNVRINESGHARRGPLWSNPCPEAAPA